MLARARQRIHGQLRINSALVEQILASHPKQHEFSGNAPSSTPDSLKRKPINRNKKLNSPCCAHHGCNQSRFQRTMGHSGTESPAATSEHAYRPPSTSLLMSMITTGITENRHWRTRRRGRACRPTTADLQCCATRNTVPCAARQPGSCYTEAAHRQIGPVVGGHDKS